MSETLLEVTGLNAWYGESHVLHGVDLAVARGETVTLLGRNGVGKTTTIRSIVGFTPPRRGSIYFDDKNIAGLPPYRIAALGIGLVPQGRRIFPSLSVAEHLSLADNKARRGAWTLERIFDLFPRLAERRHQRARTLSGGEQSMLAIARALLLNPRVLLMDEPTEGLAPVVVDAVADVIRTLRSEKQSIFLVEQDLLLALDLVDHVYVMSKGQIVWDGTSVALGARTDIQANYLGMGEAAA
jgi:branched-chain amino acid transport system ATP-binding protein